jgi:hypothetical protein
MFTSSRGPSSMNAKPMISSAKLVYSNDMYEIYISTNTNQQSQIDAKIKKGFIYFKGEFYSMSQSNIIPCSREQTDFLLSIMTRFGEF